MSVAGQNGHWIASILGFPTPIELNSLFLQLSLTRLGVY